MYTQRKYNRQIQFGLGVVIALPLFFLLHFESISIGAFKISHIWKAILVFVLVVYIVKNNRGTGKINIYIYKPLVLMTLLQIINYDYFVDPIVWLNNIAQMSLFLFVGIALSTLPPLKLQRILFFLATFFVLSFIPYELDLLQSLGEKFDMGSYGYVELFANIGPFQTPHSASSTLAMSLLVLMYFYILKSYNRMLLSVLLLLCVYFLMKTYVRTGLAMTIIGMSYFLMRNASTSVRSLYKSIIIAFFVGVVGLMYLSENQVLQDRITGQRIEKAEDSFETVGSGRALFFTQSLNIFSEFNILEMGFGVGLAEQKNRMADKIGLALVPHNGFLYLLLVNGVIGLCLFIWFLNKLWKRVARTTCTSEIFAKSCIVSYIVMTLFQNYNLVYAFLMLLISVTLVIASDKPSRQSDVQWNRVQSKTK